MTTLQSKLTDEGSLESQSAVINGWYIKIVDFGVSETLGTFVPSRDIESVNTMFAQLPISGSNPIDNATRQINLSIPPNVIDPLGNIVNTNKNINEVYLFAEGQGLEFTVDLPNNELVVNADFYNSTSTGKPIRFSLGEASTLPTSTPINLAINKTFYVIKTGTNRIKIATTKANALSSNAMIFTSTGSGTLKLGKYYLYAFGQFTPTPLNYTYTGETKLRGQLTITNLNTYVLNFTYTQAVEISDHNIDPNAHPQIQSALNYNGIFVNDIDFVYKGQSYIKNAVFHASVVNNMPVYLNSTNGKWYPALSGGAGESGKWRGIAKTSESKVICGGTVNTGHSIARGLDIFLSDITAGSIQSTVTATKIGYSLGNGDLVIQGQGSSSVTVLDDLSDVTIASKTSKQVLIVDPSGSTTNFINANFQLSYNSDVDNGISPVNKHVLFHNGTIWNSKQLTLNDIANVLIGSSPSGKYIRHNGTNFIDSDLQIPVNDGSNSYSNIKAFSFGSGFTVTESTGIATINFSGASAGLNNVVEDLTPQLGGDLDVYGGNIQIRPSISYTTLSNLPSANTFTDNNVSVNFLTTPTILAGDILRIVINSTPSIASIAIITDAHNLVLNSAIPAILTTDTVTYEILRPKVSKITNTNTLTGLNGVEIDRLFGTLGGNINTAGYNFVTGGSNINQQFTASGIQVLSSVNGTEIFSGNGHIEIHNTGTAKKIKLNNYWLPNDGSITINFPTVNLAPSTNQVLAVTASSPSSIDLGFITNTASFSAGNVIDADSSPLGTVRSMVNPVITGNNARIRGLVVGTNIELERLNSSGSIETDPNLWVNTRINSKPSIVNGSWGSASVTTMGSGSNLYSIYSKGIRGAGSVTISQEVDPTDSNKKNIIITGSSGGSSYITSVDSDFVVSGGVLSLADNVSINASLSAPNLSSNFTTVTRAFKMTSRTSLVTSGSYDGSTSQGALCVLKNTGTGQHELYFVSGNNQTFLGAVTY